VPDGLPIAGALKGVTRPENLPITRDATDADNPGSPVQVPIVDPALCVGCNQCATACPLMPPAIMVEGSWTQVRSADACASEERGLSAGFVIHSANRCNHKPSRCPRPRGFSLLAERQ